MLVKFICDTIRTWTFVLFYRKYSLSKELFDEISLNFWWISTNKSVKYTKSQQNHRLIFCSLTMEQLFQPNEQSLFNLIWNWAKRTQSWLSKKFSPQSCSFFPTFLNEQGGALWYRTKFLVDIWERKCKNGSNWKQITS